MAEVIDDKLRAMIRVMAGVKRPLSVAGKAMARVEYVADRACANERMALASIAEACVSLRECIATLTSALDGLQRASENLSAIKPKDRR